jgi:hypothetical protein
MTFREVNSVYASLTNANNACRRFCNLAKKESPLKIVKYQHSIKVDGCDAGYITEEAGNEHGYRVRGEELRPADTEPDEAWDSDL